MSRIKRSLTSIILGLLLAVVPAGIQADSDGIPVDVELVLAVDSSGSVNFTEFDLQLRGIAEAFRSPAIHSAISEGRYGRIAIVLMEWASDDLQRVNIPWMVIDGKASAERFAAEVDEAPRMIETGATSISAAMLFAAELYDGNGINGSRLVIDISGDGFNNEGPPLAFPRKSVTERGIIINGLAIENQVIGLSDYFRKYVIGGYGSFAEQADDYEAYVISIRQKLLREIRGVPLS